MRKQSLPFIELKKSIVIICIAVVLSAIVLLYCIHIYQEIMADKTSQYDEIQGYLLAQESSIDQINDIDRYHGEFLYYVVDAEMEDESVIIFVTNAEKEFRYEIYNKNNLYSKEELLSEWKNSCSDCELLDSQIGILNDFPALEIKYMNDGKLVYEHVLLEDKSKYTLTINTLFNKER
ncbi:hypothetical protein [Gracilibacillus xinjiangensis]|uniref:DUF5590 domain-containing protein n=1 Tax=Gracilibacillus xinjiangensis TaxID=1193282 RepID=A0ABV8X264_9BACI